MQRRSEAPTEEQEGFAILTEFGRFKDDTECLALAVS